LIRRTRRRLLWFVGGFFCTGTRVEWKEVEVLLDDPRVRLG